VNRLVRSVAFATAVTAALAAQDDARFLQAAFARMDGDKDGAVVRTEFPGSDRQFAAMDADKNGKVVLDEFAKSEVGKSLVRARYRAKEEPRERVTSQELRLLRFDALSRVDQNRDGKLTRAEWTGTELAFLELDLDGNGVIDKKDRQEAAGEAPTREPELPEPKGEIPALEELMKRHDKDGNAVLSPRELVDKWLKSALPAADTDGDGSLSEPELQRALEMLRRRRADRETSRARPQPYEVPFDAWDKDDDEKVRQNEWMGPLTLFAQIDADRDAAISRQELLRYEKRVRGQDFVERFDLDGDGKVSLAEFGGPTGAFRRADRNGDGAVSRGDR
jgi:Ca2+-binding EF-hand superfamily protein